jgi:hypothetical protein
LIVIAIPQWPIAKIAIIAQTIASGKRAWLKRKMKNRKEIETKNTLFFRVKATSICS